VSEVIARSMVRKRQIESETSAPVKPDA
jgi:hypothetical protein